MLVYLLIFTIISVGLAAPNDQTRIIGGEATTIEQYPFMGSMLYSFLGIIYTPSCGGSLITPSTILSAAHCYEAPYHYPSYWTVRLGSTRATSGGSLHAVSSFIFHPLYNGVTLVNDIAIVKLASAPALSDQIGIARIAGRHYNLPDGTKLYSAGWGSTWTGGLSSRTLRHADVNVINQEICADRYASLKTLPEFKHWPSVMPEMMCAGIFDVGGQGGCHGDSGGPLVHNDNIIVGIISWSYIICAHSYYPTVHVRVSNYTNWIMSNI